MVGLGRRITIAVSAAVAVYGCRKGDQPPAGQTITVAAAISTRESLEQIGRDWHAATGDTVRFDFDASGRLADQVKEGAPIDAFVSAGDREVDDLIAHGNADAASRRTVAGNALVLIVPVPSRMSGPTSLADLATSTGKVAVGDPKTVPAGQYAEQVLNRLHLADAVRPRRVLAQNVRQVLTYVEHGDVAAGLVYATDAKEAGDAVRVVDTAPAESHDPIEYPAVTVAGSAHAAAARRFIDYLGSAEARAVFASHGFEEK